jgi:hypothetical protein
VRYFTMGRDYAGQRLPSRGKVWAEVSQ